MALNSDQKQWLKKKQGGGQSGLQTSLFELQKRKPMIAQAYNKAADLNTGAATQNANQAGASFLANEGNRGGVGSSLFAGGVRQQTMAPALAESSNLRARGAESQFGAEMSIAQLVASIQQQIAEDSARMREQRLRERQFEREGYRANAAKEFAMNRPGTYAGNNFYDAFGAGNKDAYMQTLLSRLAGGNTSLGGF